MNITFVTDPLLTSYGSTRPPFLLATEMQKSGHKVKLVSSSVSEEVMQAAKEKNIEIKSLDSKFSFANSYPIVEAWAKSLFRSGILRLDDLADDEIVVNTSACIKVKSHVYYGQGPMTRALDDMCFQMPARYKYTYRLAAPVLRYLEKKAVRAYARLADSVIANSQFCASMYEDLDVEVDGVIAPPLDRNIFKPDTNKPSKDYVLTYFGVYNKETKFEILKQVVDAGIKIKAFGYKASGIPESIANHPNIQFIGAISDEELIHLYTNALYVLFTFNHEPFGYIPIESMACGTPVLTYNKQGPSESIVNGSTGWLVNNDEELLDVALKVWKNGYPKEIRQNCITRSELFDSQKISDELIEVFRKMQ